MSIKALLKRSNTLYSLNAFIKSRLQERRYIQTLSSYRAEAVKRGLSVPEGSEPVETLRQRLAARGIHPVPKPKGNLHIFLAYPLNNWEPVLPLALAPFGQVTTFEWRSLGFDDSSATWLKQRDSMNKTSLSLF
ncbi:MAG: hypothetical protein B5M53_06155 [Candidatus Cloacimonas sp. 4484_209]|nr:MAG: hypothetical protein B5M53_06155 [Candidatus Cloacimonas sp. 4484_209]